MSSSDSLDNAEATLAFAEPFGSWTAIYSRVVTFATKGLSILSQTMPSAMRLRNSIHESGQTASYLVAGDPVMRDTLNAALAQVKAGQDPSGESAELLDHIAGACAEGVFSPVVLGGYVDGLIGEVPYGMFIWSPAAARTPIGRRFADLFERELAQNISSQRAVLRSPSEEMRETLRGAWRLLDANLPRLARSLISHVHVVGIIDVADESHWTRPLRLDLCQNVSTHAIPGTVFISPSPLRSVVTAAEALFHEATHKKLSDIVLTRSVFPEGFRADKSPTIQAVWNRDYSWNSSAWSVDRALFALHFYVHHVVLLRRLAGSSDPSISSSALCAPGKIQASLDRSWYLLRELRSLQAGNLGPDGLLLLDWLDGVLRSLTTDEPAPARLKARLLLGRYDQDTRTLGVLLSHVRPSPVASLDRWTGQRVADHLIQSEIVSAYRVLATLGEQTSPTFAFYDGDRWSLEVPSGLSSAELATTLVAIRRFLSSTASRVEEEDLLRLCTTRRQKSVLDLLEEAADHSSRHIDSLIAASREDHARPTTQRT